MKQINLMLAVALVASTACGREAAPVAKEEPVTTDRSASPAGPDVLRLDPAMLRDLRMTTARVEQRTALPGW